MSLKAKVKQTIVKCLIHKCDRAYDRTYQRAQKSLSYDSLIPLLEQRENQCADVNGEKEIVSYIYDWNEAVDIEILKKTAEQGGILLLCEKQIYLHKDANRKVEDYFHIHPETLLLYGDEDIVNDKGQRSDPWLKPAWSPALFLQAHYFGGLVAIKSDFLLQVSRQWTESEIEVRKLIYSLCLAAGGYGKRNLSIAHIDAVLCHQPEVSAYNKYLHCECLQEETGCEECSDEMKSILKQSEAKQQISVVIPSKDQVEILRQNLLSLEKTVDLDNVEVLVVDNGSTEDNQGKIKKLIQELTIDIQYIYEPMEFNFSAMCNIGAWKSKGQLLLFLNDDIEAKDTGWLQHMAEMASKDYVACVGAKLRYPETDKIQHAGVVSLPQGPVHKLQVQSDAMEHYFGWNRQDRESLAVTGACLMIKRGLFEEVGGFDEELPVTFNDIDLCYKMYAKGYYNVCLNSISLYHHESLSRGTDISAEKRQRLVAEREKLQARHQELSKKDPFYHRLLSGKTTDLRVRPALEEYLRVQGLACNVSLWTEDTWKDMRRHEGVMCTIEWQQDEEGGCSLAGYLFMVGDNNACYDKKLIFINASSGVSYWCEANSTLRQDLEQAMPDQKNVALCGFEVKVCGLPAGEYEIKAVAHNKISGVSYWKETGYTVRITEE